LETVCGSGDVLSTWRAAPSSVLNFTAQRRAKCAILWRGGLAGFVDILGHQLKYSEVVTFRNFEVHLDIPGACC